LRAGVARVQVDGSGGRDGRENGVDRVATRRRKTRRNHAFRGRAWPNLVARRPLFDHAGAPDVEFQQVPRGAAGERPAPAQRLAEPMDDGAATQASVGGNAVKDVAILCDIDGTIALRGDRSPHDHDASMEDAVNKPVVKLVEALMDAVEADTLIILSGRDEKYWD